MARRQCYCSEDTRHCTIITFTTVALLPNCRASCWTACCCSSDRTIVKPFLQALSSVLRSDAENNVLHFLRLAVGKLAVASLPKTYYFKFAHTIIFQIFIIIIIIITSFSSCRTSCPIDQSSLTTHPQDSCIECLPIYPPSIRN